MDRTESVKRKFVLLKAIWVEPCRRTTTQLGWKRGNQSGEEREVKGCLFAHLIIWVAMNSPIQFIGTVSTCEITKVMPTKTFVCMTLLTVNI